jgi:hypothetical protein
LTLYENNFYRTSDGLLDIEFLFVNLGGSSGWRAYILTDINYHMFSNSRSTSCTDIHRLTEGNNELQRKVRNFMQNTRAGSYSNRTIYYICWSKTIHELDDIREVAKTWSEITAHYIRHGGSFGTIQPALKSRGIITL